MRKIADRFGVKSRVSGQQLLDKNLTGTSGANECQGIAQLSVGIPRCGSRGNRGGYFIINLLPDVLDLACCTQVPAYIGITHLTAHSGSVKIMCRFSHTANKAFRLCRILHYMDLLIASLPGEAR